MPNMEAAPLHRSLFTPLREHYGEAGQFGDKRDGRRYLSPNLATASFSAMPPTFLVLRVNEPNRGSGRVCPRAAAKRQSEDGKWEGGGGNIFEKAQDGLGEANSTYISYSHERAFSRVIPEMLSCIYSCGKSLSS